MPKSNMPKLSAHRPPKISAAPILQKETLEDLTSIDPANLRKLDLLKSWIEEPAKEAAICLG